MEMNFNSVEKHKQVNKTKLKKKSNQWLCFLSASLTKTNEESGPMRVYRHHLTLQFLLPLLSFNCDTLEILFYMQQNL